MSNRKIGQFKLPLCQRCFTTDYGEANEHSPDMCAMRVHARLSKAIRNYNLWQDRWNALQPQDEDGRIIGVTMIGIGLQMNAD